MSKMNLYANTFISWIIISLYNNSSLGYAMAQLVEALRYKQEDRGIDSRWSLGIFHFPNPSGRTMTLGSTKPLIEINTSGIS
jgi:hypothetical protein